jgi:hypothetical protein
MGGMIVHHQEVAEVDHRLAMEVHYRATRALEGMDRHQEGQVAVDMDHHRLWAMVGCLLRWICLEDQDLDRDRHRLLVRDKDRDRGTEHLVQAKDKMGTVKVGMAEGNKDGVRQL